MQDAVPPPVTEPPRFEAALSRQSIAWRAAQDIASVFPTWQSGKPVRIPHPVKSLSEDAHVYAYQ